MKKMVDDDKCSKRQINRLLFLCIATQTFHGSMKQNVSDWVIK